MKIRVIPNSQLPLDAVHTRGILTFTVSSALEYRKATDLQVIEQPDGSVVASARTPGGELIALGESVYDAVTRLATLATRP